MSNRAVRSATDQSGSPDRNTKRNMLATMMLIRSFDTQARELFRRDMIRGTTHAYIGEEAIAVGACIALQPGDTITSTHRGHGHCLAMGGDPNRMMAELLGRSTGYCNGKGGSMHIADLDLGILGANGIVGGGIAVATGAALSSQYRGTGAVTLCFFGDGAINQGIFAESANIAAMWQLPVVYICEENQYAEFSQARSTRSVEDLSLHAVPVGIPGTTVDGNDILSVLGAVAQAVEMAREGGGPSLIIAQTYRRDGHHVGDSAEYRDPTELQEAVSRDPISRFSDHLMETEGFSAADISQMEVDASQRVLAAVEFALNSPAPDVSTLMTDIYASTLNNGGGDER